MLRRDINLKILNYHIITYGCQMNEADSETIAGILTERGYQPCEDVHDADLILLITCAIRDHAEERIYGKLGQLMQIKKQKPDLIIGVGGCMTQQMPIAKKLRTKFPLLNLIFGTHNLHEFADMLDDVVQRNSRVFNIKNIDGIVVENLPKMHHSSYKANVNITYGCNNFCTYCIVPYVRGRERSRLKDDIVQEVVNLVERGYVEITLLGQNVNSYGKDLTEPVRFEELMIALADLEGLKRIRFMTSHPKDMSDELIDIVAQHDNICNHIHLPMQSGSSKVLKAMNRHYTKESYLALANRVRSKVPDCTITTDIIVGFPGETEEDFAHTLDVVKQVKFDAAYTFAYSPRPGTPAAEYENQVPEDVKKRRLHELIAVVQDLMRDSNLRCVGKTYQVMVDGVSKKDSEVFSGRTDHNKLVHFRGDYQIGQLVELEIYRATSFVLWGKPVEM